MKSNREVQHAAGLTESMATPAPSSQTGAKQPGGRRVIAVGRKINGRWQIRTSLWRYLAATAVSAQ